MKSEKRLTDFNPFPGLRPFSPEESDLFFGREGQSLEVVQRLLSNKFVTVIGSSGSGKSSLIFCGVIPRLKSGADNTTSSWNVVTFRPGTDPAGNMADAIIDNGLSAEASNETRDSLRGLIADGRLPLTGLSASGKEKKGANILFIIDQFEELFRYGLLGAEKGERKESEAFIDMIVKTTMDKRNNIFFILTMRSDFIGECAHYQGLTRLINDSNYLIPHMTRENYGKVITGPVNYMGAGIDDDLVEAILDEIGDRTDQLPVLQHALMRTWSYWQHAGQPERPLGMSDYDSVGRMANAMSRHADEAFEELSPRGKTICEVMFKTITEKGSDNKGVRRPTNVNAISSIALCTEDELYEVVDKFRVPSRSFITPRIDHILSSDSVIDISHESLMRLWDRLRHWVDEEASSVQMYLRLSEASAMYQRGKAGLWRPPDLQLAINWREKNQPSVKWAERYNPAFERAMVYLATSEKEFLAEEENKIRMQKRQLKRSRITAIVLGIAAIVSIGFMLFAFMKKLDADRQTRLAERRRIETEREKVRADSTAIVAYEKQLLADSTAVIARDNELEALRQKDLAFFEQMRAELNAAEAGRQAEIARIQSDSAREASTRAEKNEATAIAEKEKAFSLRMLAVGKQMSVKSLQVSGQKDLQTLLAYQAYIFNKRYKGTPNDADIYAGLYNAVKNYGGAHYKVFKGHQGEIKSIAFVPGKNEFYTSGQDGKVIRWLLDGNQGNFQVIYSGNTSIEVLAVSPDASWIACGDDNANIRMIPLTSGIMGFDLKGHNGRLRSLVFSNDGNSLYSSALDGKVLKWDLAAKTSRNIINDTIRITSIDISSRGRYMAGINENGKVLIWDPESAGDVFHIPVGNRVINTIRFEPSTNVLALGDLNGFIELWDVEKRERVSEGVKGHNARVSAISFNPAYNQIATASWDKTIRIWNRDDFTEPPIGFNDNDDHVLTIQFSSLGDALVSVTRPVSAESPGTMVSRATHADILADNICLLVTRNLTDLEWSVYVGKDIEWEPTCGNVTPSIKIERR